MTKMQVGRKAQEYFEIQVDLVGKRPVEHPRKKWIDQNPRRYRREKLQLKESRRRKDHLDRTNCKWLVNHIWETVAATEK